MEERLVNILNEMAEYLNVSQMKKLQEILLRNFAAEPAKQQEISNTEYLKLFLDAKRIEGCSERTLQYYRVTVERMIQKLSTPIRKMTTDEIRTYLVEYQQNGHCSRVTVDNIRRNISSFFSWLEEEDYILKSPMKRIHKIKTKTVVKDVISDESMERMRDACTEIRDLAIIDLLYSTGIRVGELVRLNIDDVEENFNKIRIVDTSILKNLEDKNEEKKVKNQNKLTCTKCKDSSFNDREELRKHYKTKWHKYNALQSAKEGGVCLSAEEYDEYVLTHPEELK